MSDETVQDILRTYVASEGPTAPMAVDDVLAAGRRARRLRRAVATSGTCAAVLGVVFAVTSLGPSRSTVDIRPPDTGVGAASPSASPGGCDATGTPRQQRITCHLTRTVPSLLANGSALKPYQGSTAGPLIAVAESVPAIIRPTGTTPPNRSTVPAGSTDDGTDAVVFTAKASVTDGQGSGSVRFMVASITNETYVGATQCGVPPFEAPSCAQRTGPAGEIILVMDNTFGSGNVDLVVAVFTEGSVVYAASDNLEGETATRPSPPLTIDQLIQIALSPELRAFG